MVSECFTNLRRAAIADLVGHDDAKAVFPAPLGHITAAASRSKARCRLGSPLRKRLIGVIFCGRNDRADLIRQIVSIFYRK
jgi:hypothetical protein